MHDNKNRPKYCLKPALFCVSASSKTVLWLLVKYLFRVFGCELESHLLIVNRGWLDSILFVFLFRCRSLLVYIRAKQEFRHYDSMDSRNKEIARILAYKLQPYVQGDTTWFLVLMIFNQGAYLTFKLIFHYALDSF